MKILPKTPENISEHEVEIIELRLKNRHLEEEFKQVKHLYEDLVEQWEAASRKIIQLEKEKKDIIKEYEDKIECIYKNSHNDVLVLKRKLEDSNNKHEAMKKDVIKEFKIKELIIDRHKEYSEVLKKELIHAKNILKDPITLKKANRYFPVNSTKLR